MNDSKNLAWLTFDIGGKQHAFASKINGGRERGTIANDPDQLRPFLRACLYKIRFIPLLFQ